MYDRVYSNFDVYTVKSRYGIAGRFVECAADAAEAAGNTVIRCPFPAYGDGLEAALVCDRGIAYIASDGDDRSAGTVNADRFLNGAGDVGVYARICRKAEAQIVSMAESAFSEISRLHRELEEIYGGCTDFEGLTGYTLAAEEVIFRTGKSGA